MKEKKCYIMLFLVFILTILSAFILLEITVLNSYSTTVKLTCMENYATGFIFFGKQNERISLKLECTAVDATINVSFIGRVTGSFKLKCNESYTVFLDKGLTLFYIRVLSCKGGELWLKITA